MSAELRLGGRIGSALETRYSVEREIARGGMSTVYLATQMPLGRRVALKVLALPTEHDDLDELIVRFRLEAYALAQLSHPNIVVVHDYGETQDGRFFLAMEYLDGSSLGELFREGPMHVSRALPLLIQVCSGLRYAHKRGVVHRDLKPSNVMIVADDDGAERVKLVDFGLVKVVESDTTITRAGLILGSPQFMAPEQIRGEQTDLRADIYSFGVMLFRAVTGRYPFTANDSHGMLEAHLVKPVPRLSDVTPELDFPPALEQVVAKCLKKAPDERYADMSELMRVLYPIIGDEFRSGVTQTSGSHPWMSMPPESLSAISRPNMQAVTHSHSGSMSQPGMMVSHAGMSRSHPGMSRSHPGMSRSHPGVSGSQPAISHHSLSRSGLSHPSMSRPAMAAVDPRGRSTALWGVVTLAMVLTASMAVIAVASLLLVAWMMSRGGAEVPAVVASPPVPVVEPIEPAEPAAAQPSDPSEPLEVAEAPGGEADAQPAPTPKPREVAAPKPVVAPKPAPSAGSAEPAPPRPTVAPSPAPAPTPAPEASPAPVPDGYFGIPDALAEPQ
ncbi:MAG: protein kinase [Myxococcota bacterium]